MSVMAETPPRPLESLSDSEMNIDATMMAASAEAAAKSSASARGQGEGSSSSAGAKRKAAALPSSPLQEEEGQKVAAKSDAKRDDSRSNTDKKDASDTPAAKKLKTASAASNGTSAAASTSLVQLKNGKFVLKQKSVEWSRGMSALQAILAFNQWLEDEEEGTKGPLSTFPDAHLGMIAMLSQESDKTLLELAKHIKNVIVPAAGLDDADSGDDEPKVDRLPLSAVTAAIEQVAERVNYGIDTIPSSSTNEVSVPAALQLWRWEVRDLGMLAPESREKITTRREERQRARAECAELLAALPQEERSAILSKGRKIKPTLVKASEPAAPLPPQTPSRPVKSAAMDEDDDDFKTPPRPVAQAPVSISKSVSRMEDSSPTKSSTSRDSPRPSSATMSPEQDLRSLDKEEKRKEREAKRAQKARKEAEKEAKKQKAEQAKKRAASFMSNFVKRPRSSSPTKAGHSEQSDFDRAFPPCNYKDMAPINRFSRTLAEDVSQKWGAEASTSADLLSELQRQPPQKTSTKKGIHPRRSVRETMKQISAASVMGDGEEGRRALMRLADRKSIPVKLLHFHTDRRPAWFGTWTRATNFISGCDPLGQDPVALDYNYDSDAEWEEVDPFDGDDVQDNDKDDEDNDSQGRSDSDSELDDWLVDDLEEEEEDEQDHPALKDPSVVGFGPPLPGTDSVNKLEPKKKVKKYKPIGRRFESKLVKFETGPHWEVELGVATYSAFQDYQMEMLNDACYGIDPFTFTTADIMSDEKLATGADKDSASTQAADTSATSVATSKDTTSAQQAIHDRALGFPDGSLGELLRAVEGSTSIRSVLLEELKQKFGSLGKGASKANMDACLHKYTEPKSKKAGSKWQIKPEYRALANLPDEAGDSASA